MGAKNVSGSETLVNSELSAMYNLSGLLERHLVRLDCLCFATI